MNVDAVRDLQLRQARHDLEYQPVLATMRLRPRLEHYVTHLAKYAGQLTESCMDGDPDRFRVALLDTVIVCLATLTATGTDAAAQLEGIVRHGDDPIRCVVGAEDDPGETGSPSRAAADAVSVHLARLARAVDKYAHSEDGGDRVPATAVQLLVIALRAADHRHEEVRYAALVRLEEVERRNIFHRLSGTAAEEFTSG